MSDLMTRLSSRKFLLTVGGVLTLSQSGKATEAVALAIAYILAEAGVDATGVVRRSRELTDAVEAAAADDGDLF